MQKRDLGVVIGKFYPPHRGHKLLIDQALEGVERLVVIVCAKSDDSIPGELRAEWLREIHPEAEVMLIDDVYDQNDSQVWADNTVRWLGVAPDVVFTSEDYGPVYAALMGSDHVMVDKHRIEVPISGTQIRGNPLANLQYLEPCVRACFVPRFVILGAESTGTTTVAEKLAERLGTVWVPEYGAEYCMDLDDLWTHEWTTEEFIDIAKEQTWRENMAARAANKVLICDTDAFATGVWHERYMGFRSHAVESLAFPHAHYFVTDPVGVPFVQNGIRDGEHIRLEMHGTFLERLEESGRPYSVLSGSLEERLDAAEMLLRLEETFVRI